MPISSNLVVLAVSLLVLLLVPSATAARVGPSVTKPIDATVTQHLELPELIIGPESVAFDKHGAGLYVSVSDDRILNSSNRKTENAQIARLVVQSTGERQIKATNSSSRSSSVAALGRSRTAAAARCRCPARRGGYLYARSTWSSAKFSVT
ncbi:hypothetical protein PR202_gb13244 [Eleusine coracana subsp. coracana]|uniref:Uncharacterized protein n=1 Tax=Eleusine coracana subsp. coracana TaxID=191504 RepID=A0AAV5ET83_ELECO|nr:hypothetical protein PR202_gb13244 [Eleusine coracana subsp. coracana]